MSCLFVSHPGQQFRCRSEPNSALTAKHEGERGERRGGKKKQGSAKPNLFFESIIRVL